MTQQEYPSSGGQGDLGRDDIREVSAMVITFSPRALARQVIGERRAREQAQVENASLSSQLEGAVEERDELRGAVIEALALCEHPRADAREILIAALNCDLTGER